MNNALINFLQTLKSIPAEDCELILSAFEHRNYQERDYLFKGGHVCREMFFIANGVLKIQVFNDKGNEVTHFFLKENQFCTILHSFNTETIAIESIQAACDVEVYAINKGKLLALYQQIPYLQNLIDRIIQKGLLDKVHIRNAYLGLDSSARYNLFLERQSDIAQRVSLGDVASYLGITQQSLSRIRKNIR